jgi:hypothetical protein
MAALSADRNTVRRSGDRFSRPVEAGAKIYAGALVCLNAAGNAVPGSVSTTLVAQGRANAQVDNTGGAAGALTVEVLPGIYRWDNSAAGDAIAQANIGANAYIVDDHTVALTSGGNTRSVAGQIVDVDANGVWVRIGQSPFPL